MDVKVFKLKLKHFEYSTICLFTYATKDLIMVVCYKNMLSYQASCNHYLINRKNCRFNQSVIVLLMMTDVDQVKAPIGCKRIDLMSTYSAPYVWKQKKKKPTKTSCLTF
uniref:Uncharacterized protein n=1 Tax=Glossina pallidipes TaxID=7398 RepID=A0A1A9ZUG7_GLOPL